MALGEYQTLFRFFHILAGITWIGLLYFFNLVNLPLLKFDMKKPFTVDMTEKATANITLKTLWWFRYGALFTVLFGLILFEAKRQSFPSGTEMSTIWPGATLMMIMVAMTLGIIMAINVWFIIWPAQQAILGNNKKIAEGGDADALGAENAPLVKRAVMASRANTWMSIPMLFGMVYGAHGQPGYGSEWGDMTYPLLVLAVVLVAMYIMSKPKKA